MTARGLRMDRNSWSTRGFSVVLAGVGGTRRRLTHWGAKVKWGEVGGCRVEKCSRRNVRREIPRSTDSAWNGGVLCKLCRGGARTFDAQGKQCCAFTGKTQEPVHYTAQQL